MNLKNKNAMGAIVGISLLIVVSVFAVFSYQNWITDFNSKLYTKTETTSSLNTIKLEYLDGNELYVTNTGKQTVEFRNIKINGFDCNINGTIEPETTKNINLGFCIEGMTVGHKEVVLLTNDSLTTQYLNLKRIEDSNFTITYNENSKTCTGLKLFGIQNEMNIISHIEMPNENYYNHSLCLYHPLVNFNLNCNTGQRLFYMGNTNNSHIWFDNTSAYPSPPGYYNWQEICIDSDFGNILLEFGGSHSGDGYLPLLEYTQNDTFGGMVGLGFTHPDKKTLWIKITN